MVGVATVGVSAGAASAVAGVGPAQAASPITTSATRAAKTLRAFIMTRVLVVGTPLKSPMRGIFCQRRATPAAAVAMDWMSTAYMSCRYTSCCAGSSHNDRTGSPSSRNATAPSSSCTNSTPPHVIAVTTGSRNSSP